ncbi:MAG: PEP-CTERM sorting domain-containing protein [bacterium]|nr:PEP-CTERM sorting domain-containing protein [bacterium]
MQARSGNGYVQQSFLAGEATAGTYGSFTVTMDLGIRSNSGVTMPLRVEIWNVTDDVSLASETYTYPTSGTGFIETKAFSLSYNNGAQDAGDEIALRITNATSSNVEWETTTWLDNVTVEAVPEPATMSLLALGGLGVLARRRRRA